MRVVGAASLVVFILPGQFTKMFTGNLCSLIFTETKIFSENRTGSGPKYKHFSDRSISVSWVSLRGKKSMGGATLHSGNFNRNSQLEFSAECIYIAGDFSS